MGRKRRTVPTALRRALNRRDGACRFPDHSPSASGARASRFCDAHHIHHWASGGETKLENLTLLCRRHHRLVHEGGWRMEMRRHGEARFYRPDGRPMPDVPPSLPLGDDPVKALERQQGRLGIDAWTPTPRWDGERLDVDWALFTLWQAPRAVRDVSKLRLP